MSFSSEVKKELLSVENENCCALAQCYGFMLFSRTFSNSEFSFLTEKVNLAEYYCDCIKYLSNKTITAQKTTGQKYKITINDKEIISACFNVFGIELSPFKKRVNFALFQNPCCFSAFIRGVFLASGTVTNPEKDYHLEFSVSSKGLCDDLVKIFDEFDPVPKTSHRGGSYTVYFKNSTDIEDILSLMGATESSLQFMGTKVYKDIRNTINRKVNFENANLARTVAAAIKQYDAICVIKDKAGLDSLPKELRQIAELRLNDREMSNSEIAKALPEGISVSGVNHRFKRILNIAEELKK